MLCDTAAGISLLSATAVVGRVGGRALGHWSGWLRQAVDQLSASHLLLINPTYACGRRQLNWGVCTVGVVAILVAKTCRDCSLTTVWRPPRRRRRAGRLDRRGDTAESPEGRGGGGRSRTVKVRWLLSCVGAPHTPSSITTWRTRWRPSLRGWSPDGS